MSKKSNDIKLNSQRVSFSKSLKRKILIEITKGRKPQDVLLEYAFDSLKDVSDDKKYASKLIHKWKKEVYEHKEFLYLINHKLDNESLDYEIENMFCEDDDEPISEFFFTDENNLKKTKKRKK